MIRQLRPDLIEVAAGVRLHVREVGEGRPDQASGHGLFIEEREKFNRELSQLATARTPW